MPGTLKFDHEGIAHLIADKALSVPVYQRSYSWELDEDNQVGDFWDDLVGAFLSAPAAEYFLGTVVLTPDTLNPGRLRVIDGQQRLATCSILLAAVRDAYATNNRQGDADIVESEYLVKSELGDDDPTPRLVLNADDDDFYQQRVVGGAAGEPQRSSHKRIADAYALLARKVAEFVADRGAVWPAQLKEFVNFLRDRVLVVTVTVPTEADAYTIFETLNDRGAGLTVADLLKNFLYSKSGAHIEGVRTSWDRALASLRTTASDHEFATFLRHYWSSREGVTRERDLYKEFKKEITSTTKARAFARDLEKAAKHYAALLSPTHEIWDDYSDTDREAVVVLAKFDLAPNKELLLALLAKWPPAKVKQALRVLVNWSVRLLVEGAVNNSAVESAYCNAAVKVRAGTITTRNQLFAEVQPQIPGDTAFKAKFAIARVTKSALARYYLYAIERHKAKAPQPELVPNTNTDAVNLEHVLPKNSGNTWPALTDDQRRNLPDRIGNLCLLPKGPNGRLGAAGFATKKPVLAGSQFQLTKDEAKESTWDETAIGKRQAALAAVAVKVWPLLP